MSVKAIPIEARRFQAAIPGPPVPDGPVGPVGPAGPPAPYIAATLNLPSPVGVFEHYETIVDVAVLPTSRIAVILAGTTEDFNLPIATSAQATATTIVCPATPNVIWRVTAGYYVAP